MQGKAMGMAGNLGTNLNMFNFPMQAIQPLLFPKDLEPQSNLLKYVAGGVDSNHPQEQSKTGQPNSGVHHSKDSSSARGFCFHLWRNLIL